MTYRPAAIATYLTDHEHAHPDAAHRAATAIAEAWNRREFWQSATLTPLTTCAATSPHMPPPADVLARLIRRFGTHLHNVPAWDPTTAPAPAAPELARLTPPRRPGRVLVTGSRTWTDHTTIRTALTAVWHPATVLVSGACPRGADHLCEQCWTAWGGNIERHPADWTRQHRAAGMIRNQHMVTLGADLCLAFIHNRSRGATHCADLAERAGIPIRRYHQHGRRVA